MCGLMRRCLAQCLAADDVQCCAVQCCVVELLSRVEKESSSRGFDRRRKERNLNLLFCRWVHCHASVGWLFDCRCDDTAQQCAPALESDSLHSPMTAHSLQAKTERRQAAAAKLQALEIVSFESLLRARLSGCQKSSLPLVSDMATLSHCLSKS